MNHRNSHTMLITRYISSEFSLNTGFLRRNVGVSPLWFDRYHTSYSIDSFKPYMGSMINKASLSTTIINKSISVTNYVLCVSCYSLCVMCSLFCWVTNSILYITNNYNALTPNAQRVGRSAE